MSTYSSTLRLELIGNGEQDGTWGDTTNTNLGTLIEAAITNSVNITFSDAQYTLSANNGLPDEARNAVLNLVGTNTTAQNLIAPAVKKTYIVRNNSGATVTIKTSGGTGVPIPTGATQIVWCDGSTFYSAATQTSLVAGSGISVDNVGVSSTISNTGVRLIGAGTGSTSGVVGSGLGIQQVQFQAAIAGTTMTVSSVTAGALYVGGVISTTGAGFTPGTTVVAQLTGPTGGAGTYTVSASQTVSSSPMTQVGTVGNMVLSNQGVTSIDVSGGLAASSGTVTGSIAGTTLTLGGATTVPLIGATVSGTGVTAGTKITGFLTGILGANGSTYQVSASQTVSSTTLTLSGTGPVTLSIPSTSNGFGVRSVLPSPITSASITASVATNVLTVSAVASGTLRIGSVVTSTGLPNNTTITAVGTGTGGTGTYTLSSTCASGTVATTNGSATVTLTVSSGTVALGQTITSTSIPSGTAIVAFGTGTGGSGTYIISNQSTVDSSGVSFTNTVISTTMSTNTSGTASFTGSASSGTTTLTASSVTGGIMVGAFVTGTGIAAGTYIAAYGATTYGGAGTYTLSQATTGAVSGTVTASATPTGGSSGDIVYGY